MAVTPTAVLRIFRVFIVGSMLSCETLKHRRDSVMTSRAKLRTRPATPMSLSLFCKDLVTQR